MDRLLLFGLLSIPVLAVSWRSLLRIRSHGFYRFFGWECILWLLVSNYTFWFEHPASFSQILSWIILLYSGYIAIAGFTLLIRKGKPVTSRADDTLFQFEKTSELIDTGIFRYIRHPLYSSLIFLAWGVLLKHTTGWLLLVAILATAFLYLTAIFDEKECVAYFGGRYTEYMKRSKRFIPFIV
jgi:protein-S-isoprenylcysteine O-methyltransferase Ste14